MADKQDVMKVVNIVLLVVAGVALLFGVIFTCVTASIQNHDGSKVAVQITSLRTDVGTSVTGRTTYYAYTNYHIENGTGADIYYISLKTYVYDAAGDELGYLTAELGSTYQASSDLNLAAGAEMDQEFYISSYTLTEGELFTKIYQSEFSDFTYESHVLKLYYTDGQTWAGA